MIRVVTTEQMRTIDSQAIAGDTDIGYTYMTRAATGLCTEVVGLAGPPPGRGIAIVCGKGNNGGDGYVLGRMLRERGYAVECFALCRGDELVGEARRGYDEYVAAGGKVCQVASVSDLAGLDKAGIVVDGLLGTGITGNPRGLTAETIEVINQTAKTVVAVDTPSGLNNNTGAMGDPTVGAKVTVTMGFPKLGQFYYPGRDLTGRLAVVDLGYPDDVVTRVAGDLWTVEQKDLRSLLPARNPTGSKFDHGLAFMLCGSRGMTGSATLAAEAALRSGCGMTHLACPHSALSVLAGKVTETVLHPIDETETGSSSLGALDTIIELSANMHVALVGPGISHNDDTCKLVRSFITRTELPVVLDADGINAYRDAASLLKERSCELVMTPHAGEWSRVFGDLPGEPTQRVDVLSATAADNSMTILLKGNPTLVADGDGKVTIVALGNSSLASAGSGDVLAGLIAGFVAQGLPVSEAAVLGAAVHGLAGEMCSLELGEHSVIASDVLVAVPRVIKSLADEPRTGILL